jgi:hypothetical protein
MCGGQVPKAAGHRPGDAAGQAVVLQPPLSPTAFGAPAIAAQREGVVCCHRTQAFAGQCRNGAHSTLRRVEVARVVPPPNAATDPAVGVRGARYLAPRNERDCDKARLAVGWTGLAAAAAGLEGDAQSFSLLLVARSCSVLARARCSLIIVMRSSGAMRHG